MIEGAEHTSFCFLHVFVCPTSNFLLFIPWFIALNSIKNMYGKERAVYDSSMESKVDVQRKIESSMRQALKEKQFKVFYQPKHNSVTGELVGAEALIRWIHPEFGFMSPGDFIPLFEKNGFIVETDYYVWERTCQNIKRWQDMGLKTIPISVNASKMVFEQQDLLEKTKQTVLDDKCKSVLYIAGKKDSFVSDERLKGIKELCKELKIKLSVKDGEFSSCQNFKDRTKVSQTIVEKMRELNLLYDLPLSDQLSLLDYL